MSEPQRPFFKPGKSGKPKRPRDPHPNDRFAVWKMDEFVREIRQRARAEGIPVNAPEIRAIARLTIEVLKDAAFKGIIINLYGFMRWGPHTHRACTFTRNGQEIQKRAYTVPHVKFSRTYRNRVKEAHKPDA